MSLLAARVLCYGAGVQTTALLVLIATGRLDRPDAILFADTGGEHAETYAYLDSVARPYAQRHGLEIVTVGAEYRAPRYRLNLDEYCRKHNMVPGTFQRWCTVEYKIKSLHRYALNAFSPTPDRPVEEWIGISQDEARRQRISPDPRFCRRYPLIELGLSRADCLRLIVDAGLPVPPKSGCWFCPFQRRGQWQTLKRTRPDLFERALELERNARPHPDGTPRYLPVFGSLEQIASQNALPGFDAAIEAEAGCSLGHCFV